MNIKNILLIGRTGGGKSTLANTLINQNNNFEEVFKESAGSVSETKQVQIKEFIVNITEDGSEKVRYLVIDTAGFGDTKLTDKEVLQLMSELVRIIGNDGLIQVLFVTNSRFTHEEIDVYQKLESVVFDNQVNKYTTVVKTKFPEFENEVKCEEDRQKFQAENPELARIFNSSKIIYVDNPPLVGRPAAIELNKEVRGESRKRVLTHLGKCQNIYQPGNLNTLNQRIESYKTQKENFQNQISSLNNQISYAQSNHWSQIQALENRHQQEIQGLEQRRQNELNKIQENSNYGYIDNPREYYTIRYSRNKDATGLTATNPVCLNDWNIMKDDFNSSLRGKNIPLRYYSLEEARQKLGDILYYLGSPFNYIRVSSSKHYQFASEAKNLRWRHSYHSWSDLTNFVKYSLDDYEVKNGFYVALCEDEDYRIRTDKIVSEIRIGVKEHPKREYVDLERALREASEVREYEISGQIERIKQQNQAQTSRIWQELENQKYLNDQRVTQERQSIQSNLDSTRQSSQARIAHVQQQINDAERNFEQQVQQQTNLPSIGALAGMITKMFIK